MKGYIIRKNYQYIIWIYSYLTLRGHLKSQKIAEIMAYSILFNQKCPDTCKCLRNDHLPII